MSRCLFLHLDCLQYEISSLQSTPFNLECQPINIWANPALCFMSSLKWTIYLQLCSSKLNSKTTSYEAFIKWPCSIVTWGWFCSKSDSGVWAMLLKDGVDVDALWSISPGVVFTYGMRNTVKLAELTKWKLKLCLAKDKKKKRQTINNSVLNLHCTKKKN